MIEYVIAMRIKSRFTNKDKPLQGLTTIEMKDQLPSKLKEGGLNDSDSKSK